MSTEPSESFDDLRVVISTKLKMEQDMSRPSPAVRPRRSEAHLAEATAEDRQTAACLAQAEKTAAARAEQLGRVILGAAHRMNRIGDLATVMKAVAHKEKDAAAIAALAHPPSAPKNHGKQ
jgi:hypothetical protein